MIGAEREAHQIGWLMGTAVAGAGGGLPALGHTQAKSMAAAGQWHAMGGGGRYRFD